MNFEGFRRSDGSVGIRNKVLIVAVDECCDGISREIAKNFTNTVVLTNWYTCMLGGNEETFNQMVEVSKTPNVAGVVVVAMGCGSILPSQITELVRATGRPAEELCCIKLGGTRKCIAEGIEKVKKIERYIDSLVKEEFPMSKLVIGIKCGGSDTSSGLASNPSVGRAADKLVDMGAICIAGELFELQGCEDILDRRAVSPDVAAKINTLINNERRRWSVKGADVETMSVGNCIGGLTTIEEKSLGALHKTGSRPIVDVLQINNSFIDKPSKPGFYLSEATMLCGGAGINYASLGAHIVLWTSGAAGFNNSIVPVIRVSGNKELFNEDMDVDASGILEGTHSINEVAEDIVEKVRRVASGEFTAIEGVGDSTMTLYQKDVRVENLLGLHCVK